MAVAPADNGMELSMATTWIFLLVPLSSEHHPLEESPQEDFGKNNILNIL